MESLSTFEIERETIIAELCNEGFDEDVIRELCSYIDEGMNEWVMGIRLALRTKWDRIIAVTGRRGVAKSTLTILLAKLIDYDFTFDRLAFVPTDVIPILQNLPLYSSMVADEGAEILYRGDYASKISKTIIKQTIGDRWIRSARFIIAPSIFNLDKSMIPMLDYWIKVYSPDGTSRGYAEIRSMTERDYTNDKLPYAPAVYDVRFDDLPESVALLYEQYKAEQGSKRTAEYQKLIEKKSEMGGDEDFHLPDMDAIALEVSNKKERYLSKKTGEIDWRLVYMEYKNKNLSKESAKTISSWLNKMDELGFPLT